MKSSVEIQEYEERLKEAMLQSNVLELDKLLADDLMFINHMGLVMTKQDDIQAHKSNILKINELTLSEQSIKIISDIAIVTVKAKIKGSYNGEVSDDDFRFTRVWSKESNNLWKITAVHSSRIC